MPPHTTMTEPQLASYLAGMIDHTCTFSTNSKSKRSILMLKSRSKKQILLIQERFGGEIRGHRGTDYQIYYRKTAALKILSLVAPFVQTKRAALIQACVIYQVEPPTQQIPLIDYYIAGAIDARNSFHHREYGSRTYSMFCFTYYRDCDRDYLAVNGQTDFSNGSIGFTANLTKTVLEKVKPFVLEYEKYRRAIYDGINEEFDSSILTSKDHAYYLADQERMRQAAAQAKIDRKTEKRRARERKISERQRRAQEKRDGRLRVSEQCQVAQSLLASFLSDHEAALSFDLGYDHFYHIQYRSKKQCRLCKTELDLDLFHAAGGAAKHRDPLKHECKRCHYQTYVKPHLPKLAARTKAWQKANPEKTKIAQKKQSRKSHVRIRGSMGKRVKEILGYKSEKYYELIGCTSIELTRHLESLFKPGMTWENYGDWHVDHKTPCRAFDLSVKEERLKCFHYTNLQPLWAAENLAKSDSLPDGTNARERIVAA